MVQYLSKNTIHLTFVIISSFVVYPMSECVLLCGWGRKDVKFGNTREHNGLKRITSVPFHGRSGCLTSHNFIDSLFHFFSSAWQCNPAPETWFKTKYTMARHIRHRFYKKKKHFNYIIVTYERRSIGILYLTSAIKEQTNSKINR